MHFSDYGLSFYLDICSSRQTIYGTLGSPILIKRSDLLVFGVKYNSEVCAFLCNAVHKNQFDFTLTYYEQTGIRNVFNKKFRGLNSPVSGADDLFDVRGLVAVSMASIMETENLKMFSGIYPKIKKIANSYA